MPLLRTKAMLTKGMKELASWLKGDHMITDHESACQVFINGHSSITEGKLNMIKIVEL